MKVEFDTEYMSVVTHIDPVHTIYQGAILVPPNAPTGPKVRVTIESIDPHACQCNALEQDPSDFTTVNEMVVRELENALHKLERARIAIADLLDVQWHPMEEFVGLHHRDDMMIFKCDSGEYFMGVVFEDDNERFYIESVNLDDMIEFYWCNVRNQWEGENESIISHYAVIGNL